MRSNDRPLGDVIKEVLKKYRLEDHLVETQLIESWRSVCGDMIAMHTLSLSVKEGTMYVKVDSSALRQELQYRKEKLMEMLNKTAGREVIRDMVFR